ncbi:MAG: hypothetical protein ACI8P9_000792 [Parasphingorhabdus sp.]|jgi:hypothetical protein
MLTVRLTTTKGGDHMSSVLYTGGSVLDGGYSA